MQKEIHYLQPELTQLDPWKLCTNEERLSFALDLDQFERLKTAVSKVAGQAHFELEFAKTQQHLLEVRGSLSTCVTLECQRCLEAVQQPLAAEFVWGLVSTEEAAINLPREYEPVYLNNDRLDLLAVLEDEVILALPLVAYHPEGECEIPQHYQADKQANLLSEAAGLSQAASNQAGSNEQDNPFKVLAGLRETLKDQQ